MTFSRYIKITGMLFIPVIAVQLCLIPVPAADAEIPLKVTQAVSKSLDYLAKTQNPDGSWPDNYGKSPAVVGLIVLAFLGHGEVPGRGKYKDTLEKATKYIMSCAQDTGLISQTGSQPMYNHGFSTLALAEVYGMSKREDIGKALNSAVDLICRTQNSRGGWRYQARPADDDITVSGAQLMALRAAKNAGVDVPKEVIDNGVKYIASCACSGGGFGYQPGGSPGKARTGIGVLLLQLLGEEESKAVEEGADYLLKNPLTPGESYFYYATYYCSQAMYQKGGKYWEEWEKNITETLLSRQNSDGSFNAQSSEGGAYYAVAMAVLALEINWKYLPIYQR
jgi:hypothetical protein